MPDLDVFRTQFSRQPRKTKHTVRKKSEDIINIKFQSEGSIGHGPDMWVFLTLPNLQQLHSILTNQIAKERGESEQFQARLTSQGFYE